MQSDRVVLVDVLEPREAALVDLRAGGWVVLKLGNGGTAAVSIDSGEVYLLPPGAPDGAGER